MNSFLQLLSKYKETSKVGQANIVKPGQNVIIASQKIGYPDQLNKSIEIYPSFKVIGHPLHTSRDKTKAMRNRREQLTKINNQSSMEFIDTNLGSANNSSIISEINNILDKILSNIETGAFYDLVVNDMYQLLGLFKKNVYKFDTYTLNDYKTYLLDMFTVTKSADYKLVVGSDRQDKNLLKLIQKIGSQIMSLIFEMLKHMDKSPYERKLILNNLILKKSFIVDTKTIKNISDIERQRAVAAEQRKTLQEIANKTLITKYGKVVKTPIDRIKSLVKTVKTGGDPDETKDGDEEEEEEETTGGAGGEDTGAAASGIGGDYTKLYEGLNLVGAFNVYKEREKATTGVSVEEIIVDNIDRQYKIDKKGFLYGIVNEDGGLEFIESRYAKIELMAQEKEKKSLIKLYNQILFDDDTPLRNTKKNSKESIKKDIYKILYKIYTTSTIVPK